MTRNPNGRTGPHRVRAAYAAVLLAGGLGLGACAEDAPEEDPVDAIEQEVEEETDAPEAEDIDDGTVGTEAGEPTMLAMELLQDPESHVDENVVVQAEVGQVVGDGAFTIVPDEGDAAGGVEERLLVLGPTTDLAERDVIVVAGGVRADLDQVELEEQYGIDWPDGALDEYAGGPWLDASAIERDA